MIAPRRVYLTGTKGTRGTDDLAVVAGRLNLVVVDCRPNPHRESRAWSLTRLETALPDDLTWKPGLAELGFVVAEHLTPAKRWRGRKG